ncbi:MAG: hypothetical protein Q8P53_03745 [Candidatus Shapirobacteria bacterium]|nr:hypothetical protein [Candidatus Shapirobacteria bacterium]
MDKGLKTGQLIIITGPSGVGKDSIAQDLKGRKILSLAHRPSSDHRFPFQKCD